MNDALNRLDLDRKKVSRDLQSEKKSELGQYMTPSNIADYMASLPIIDGMKEVRMLDAGTGIGSLSIAFFERFFHERKIKSLEWVGYEVDKILITYLEKHLQQYQVKFKEKEIEFSSDLHEKDFIEDTVKRILYRNENKFNLAILNPPYKKIQSRSYHRLLLRELKIETVNLYSAFLALVIDLLIDGGQVVAIIPRSFCNGPYYKSFRMRLLQKTAIHHIHLFTARDKAFHDEQVLQENIIILLERRGNQGTVKVSTSTDGAFEDYAESIYPFSQIVSPNDPEYFIHVPTSDEPNPLDYSSSFQHPLSDLGIEVSTGPVVDFRIKDHLRMMPGTNTVPLLYPGHFSNYEVEWPNHDKRKPNAIELNSETKRWLFPNGFYVVVRRFSSKEERRRIVASVIDPAKFNNNYLGLENHLNVFHIKKHGLPEDITYGLGLYLNSTFVDKYFRRFSGHTQVNATDLRLLKYPSLEILAELGRRVKDQSSLNQELIDREVNQYVK